MARITVEDCIEIVPNRFELVVLAASRAKKISSGAPLTVNRDNDKDAVVALREIAEKTIDIDNLREETIQGFQLRHMREDFVPAPFAGELEGEVAGGGATATTATGDAADTDSAASAGEEDASLADDSSSDEAASALDDELKSMGSSATLDAPEGMSFADEDVVDVDD